MDGMWFMIFWMTSMGAIESRPQHPQFFDSQQNLELVPLLNGGVFPLWISRDQLQPISNLVPSFYRITSNFPNGGGSIGIPDSSFKANTKQRIKSKEDTQIMNKNVNTRLMDPMNKIIEDLTEDSLKSMNSNSSLAPYRFHPLLNFLRQRINLGEKKIIEVRNDKSDVPKATTTLILKPVAKSVAGVDGKAIANPVSRAALRKGVNADILFEPDAVAIAGPGGIAHAESDLEIYYEDDEEN